MQEDFTPTTAPEAFMAEADFVVPFVQPTGFWTEYWILLAANIATSLLLIPVAVLAIFVALRWRDRVAGIQWPDLRDRLLETPTSAAIYASAWVLGVALIVSAAIR